MYTNPAQYQAIMAAIIESSEDAIISKDLSSRITSWNKAAERMFGYSEAEMLGRQIHILIPDDRLQEEDHIISTLRAGRKVEQMHTIRKTKDERLLHITLTISPIYNDQGIVVGASKIARDVTRQKRFEEGLQRITEVSKEIFSNHDEEAILQRVTDAATELAGAAFGAFFYNKIDSAGQSYTLYALSGAPKSAFEKFGMPRNTQVFAETFSGNSIVRSDDITKDPRYGHNTPHHGMPQGHLPVVSYLAVPVTAQAGGTIGGLFFGHGQPGRFNEDHEHFVAILSSQAAIALENARLYREVQVLSAKKDEFIGFASHELKTPLTTLKGYLQMAIETGISMEEISPKMEKQVRRLETLVNELLDISKIQSGQLQFSFARFNLHDLVTEALENLDTSTHQLKVDLPAGDIWVVGDESMLAQVLVNLLVNALKYAPPATAITVKAAVEGDMLEVAVHDEGPGIPPGELHLIFNRFYRISTVAAAKGIGLGLFISKEIIDAHQGKIWAESAPGEKGASFYFRIPLNQPAPPAKTVEKSTQDNTRL